MTRKPMIPVKLKSIVLAIAAVALTTPAQAHIGQGVIGGFSSGFLHPIFGWDHVVAMVAVGLWAASLERPAVWLLPVVFPLVMAFGGVLGVLGVPVPAIETGIGLSGVVLGLMVLFTVQAPIWAAATLVGVFAIFHGYAHGTELPTAANPAAYGIGFIITTGILHLFGIGSGFLMKGAAGRIAVRGMGAIIALVGGAFLFGFA